MPRGVRRSPPGERWLSIGHHQHHRLGVGVAAQVPAGQCESVVQVGALLVDTLQPGQFGGRHGACVPAEGDDLQRVGTESGAHQMIQCQRGASIGSQRFSITIENEVSTSSATAAWVRGPGLGDLDIVDGDPDRSPPAPGSPARRSTALTTVRVTFHGSLSPNAQGRVAPVSSPAAPARRVSCSSRPARSCCATSRSAARPSGHGPWLIAATYRRTRGPGSPPISARSNSRLGRAPVAAWSPSWRASASRLDVVHRRPGVAL